MRRTSRRPALGLHIPQVSLSTIKHGGVKGVGRGRANVQGSLSPNLQPSTPPTVQLKRFDQTEITVSGNSSVTTEGSITDGQIDGFVLAEEIDSTPSFKIYKAVCSKSGQPYFCKVIPLECYQLVLAPYYRARHVDGIAGPECVLVGTTHAYALFPQPRTDLHSYVRSAGKISESEARSIFGQIADTVKQCHDSGLVLRDIKLRKCVFTDPIRTLVKLTGLEDAHTINDQSDDLLEDKHGCPAYVSPEILQLVPSIPGKRGGYSGRAADAWSLGVILYTMLVGRYPFQDSEPIALFSRISIGRYILPDTLSPRARCLIRGLLCKDPSQRLTVADILNHPWFICSTTAAGWGFTGGPLDEIGPATDNTGTAGDQSVPDYNNQSEDSWLY